MSVAENWQDYLSREQIEQLLKAVNPRRVGKDGKGFSHMEAYELRIHMNRIFGFARWSEDLLSQEQIFETETPAAKQGDKVKWTVAYRSVVKVTICAPNGTVLAWYSEGAVGDASNQPSRADAHDLALKTSQSQALKRALVNLGEQFGASLYAKGSLAALTGKTLVLPPSSGDKPTPEVDDHVTDTPPEEGSPADVAVENRERSTPITAETTEPNRKRADHLRDQALAICDDTSIPKRTALSQLMKLQLAAQSAGDMKVEVADGAGVAVTLGAFLESCVKLRQNGTAVPA